MNIQVVEVKDKAQLKRFLGLPHEIYKDPTSPYVMPLELHMSMMMGKLGSPEKHFFIAESKGRDVARVGIKTHKTATETRLHFGFFECLDDFPEAAEVLFKKAHSLYPNLEMMGPFQFKQEDPYIGILVEGFQFAPYFMMPYNSPSYDTMLKKSGLSGVMDLYTYDLKRDEGLPTAMLENSKRCREEFGLKFRSLDKKNLDKEARIIAKIFNEALSNNWGFEEFLDDQVKEMVTLFKLFIDPRVVLMAMKDGKEIGCLLMIPNYNHVIKPSKGKLGPGLIWRYLRRNKTTSSIRGYALGVLKAFQGKGVGSALTDEMYRVAKDTPYANCEVSWVLANNSSMNDLAMGMGGKQNKVYRVYQKAPLINVAHN